MDYVLSDNNGTPKNPYWSIFTCTVRWIHTFYYLFNYSQLLAA